MGLEDIHTSPMSEVTGETFGTEGPRHSKNELAGVEGYEHSDPLGISSI